MNEWSIYAVWKGEFPLDGTQSNHRYPHSAKRTLLPNCNNQPDFNENNKTDLVNISRRRSEGWRVGRPQRCHVPCGSVYNLENIFGWIQASDVKSPLSSKGKIKQNLTFRAFHSVKLCYINILVDFKLKIIKVTQQIFNLIWGNNMKGIIHT